MPSVFQLLFKLLSRVSPNFFTTLDRHIPKDGVIFDVGSFHGNYSRHFLDKERLFPSEEAGLRIYLFDGNPDTKNFVEDILSTRVSFHNVALTNTIGMCKFYINTLIPSSGSGVSDVVKTSSWVRSRAHLMSLLGKNKLEKRDADIFRTLHIRCQTLDSFCSEQNVLRIDLLKIDVEGEELNVLLGAQKNLEERKIQTIQVEVLDKKVSHEEKFQRIVTFLSAHGFQLLARKQIFSVGVFSDIRADEALFTLRRENPSSEIKDCG